MSDNWIILIPEDGNFVPPPAARERAVELFWNIAPDADDVTEEVSDEIRLIDCGANLETITCLDCGAELSSEWWRDTVEQRIDTPLLLVPLPLPCCGAIRSLDRLIYDWPQGFARFSVEAMNPGIPDLDPEQMRAFASVLGCRLRKILQHL